jgi:hypothetical protein
MIGWLLKFLGGGNLANLAIAAAVVAGVAGAAGLSTGWTLNGWRLAGRIERLEGRASALEAANQRCGVNVAEVKAAVGELVKAGELRAAAAAKALREAEKAALGHLARAGRILKAPPVPPEKQCDTVRDEQRGYVRQRHQERP